MQRKIEQGSQQLQGEVMEIALERLLNEHFRHDEIVPVPKGVFGGDCLQKVRNTSMQECGTILWETKRTKNWSQSWLAKLREDQREAKASLAIIVSEALPDGINSFGCVEGIWICSWSFAK